MRGAVCVVDVAVPLAARGLPNPPAAPPPPPPMTIPGRIIMTPPAGPPPPGPPIPPSPFGPLVVGCSCALTVILPSPWTFLTVTELICMLAATPHWSLPSSTTFWSGMAIGHGWLLLAAGPQVFMDRGSTTNPDSDRA